MYLIPLAIIFAVAAMGVFIYSFVVSLRGSRGNVQKELVPVVPVGTAGPSQLEVEQLKNEIPELKAQLASSQLQIDKLSTDNENLRKEIVSMAQGITQDVTRAGDQDLVPKARARELEQQISSQETFISQLKDELSSEKTGLENTTIKAQALLSELEGERKKSDELAKENGVCKAQIAAWQEEIEKIKSENDRLCKELNEQQKSALLTESSKTAQGDPEALSAKIEDYNKEIAKLNDIISDLRKKEDLAGLISKEEYDQVKRQINDKESLLSRLKSELEGIKPQYEVLQAGLEQEKKNEAQLSRKLDEMAREMDELKKQPQNRFPAEIAYLRKKLNLNDESSDKDVLVSTIEALEDSLHKEGELEKQLQVSAQSLRPQDSGRTVSEDEYIKVKQKLEAAEKILRLIHGAG